MTERPASLSNPYPGYVLDANNATEMARLMAQDRLLTRSMGGVLPEQTDSLQIQDALDIACGPGGWLLDLVKQYPHIHGNGIDISSIMIEYAASLASTQRLNVQFHVMDATQPLRFSNNTFDLVNGRILTGFLTTQQWSELFVECARITKPGGILRLTEAEWGFTNSAALDTLQEMAALALHRAGHSFSPHGRTFGTANMLRLLMRRAGYQNIQYRAHAIDFSARTADHQSNVENMLIFHKLFQPFLVQMQIATQEELQQLYDQMKREMQKEDFCAIDFFLTVWGYKGDAKNRASKELRALHSEDRDKMQQLLKQDLPAQEILSSFSEFMRSPEHRESIKRLAEQITFVLEEHTHQRVPASLYADVHRAIALTPDDIRTWSVFQIVMERMLLHLDPEQQGMSLLIILCMPPSGGFIRSLRTNMSIGTNPWPTDFSERLAFLGQESFAGHVVSTGHPDSIQVLQENSLLPNAPSPYENSLAAAPLCRAGRIAGCLLVSSSTPSYFESAGIELALIQAYADLLVCGLNPEDFYEPKQINLQILLPYEKGQKEYIKNFQQRVAAVLRESAMREEVRITKKQAEDKVRREIEQLLLTAGKVTPTEI
jgi:ubiquinone/menaquinone biosynthesis C-methylase UbiE